MPSENLTHLEKETEVPKSSKEAISSYLSHLELHPALTACETVTEMAFLIVLQKH